MSIFYQTSIVFHDFLVLLHNEAFRSTNVITDIAKILGEYY